MPNRLPVPAVFFALLLAACGSKDQASDGISIALAPPAEATAIMAGVTGRSQSGTASAVATVVAPANVITPKPGVQADVVAARRLESEGDVQGAADAYIAVAARQDRDAPEAYLGAARMLLAQDRAADARVVLETFRNSPGGRDDGPSLYMLARAHTALKEYDQALAMYDAYIATRRPALPYAYIDRSKVLAALNRFEDAANSVSSGLAQNVPLNERRISYLAQAQDYERNGNLAQAIRAYNQLIDVSSGSGDIAIALQRIAALKKLQGDPTARDTQNRLLLNYPGTSQALEELRSLLAAGEIVSPYVRGLVYYRHNNYDSAEVAFKEQLSDFPNDRASAESAYYLAAIAESRGRTSEAADGYARTVQLNPDSGLADDALWWRGRILEDDKKLDEARAIYERLLKDYPASSWAKDAAFRRGLLHYRAGKYGEAAGAWGDALPNVIELEDRQRLTLWRGKALLKANDKTGGFAELQRLSTDSELDYFGMRAAALLQDKNGLPKATRESRVDFSVQFDWPGAEAWLASKTGRLITNEAWLSDRRWARAQELWTVGRDAEASLEIYDLMESLKGDPIAMYTMSRALFAQGKVSHSARAGQRLMRALRTNPNAGLPKALLSLSYPPAFNAPLQKYAAASGISPLLMLAFIRQESFFDPRAESGAGALGLTQLLPDTARAQARKLNLPEIGDNEDILTADLNLHLGAQYMADQVKSFDNEIFVAFAAYNAGPGPAKRWRQASGDDPDIYLEAIEYSESRLYVQLVGENYAIYRYLYGGESTINWP